MKPKTKKTARRASGSLGRLVRQWKREAIELRREVAATNLKYRQHIELYHKLWDLLSWAETLLCNAECPKHCKADEWRDILKRWRDEKHASHN